MKEKITKEEIIRIYKKVGREIDLERDSGFHSTDRVHRNRKKYNRKSQSWKNDWLFSFIRTVNWIQNSSILSCYRSNKRRYRHFHTVWQLQVQGHRHLLHPGKRT